MAERISRDDLRRLLEARRAQLLRDMEVLRRDALDSDGTGGGQRAPIHLADMASDVQSQEFAADRLTMVRDLLRRIDDAIARLAGDQYGLCEVCQNPIPRRRLEISPWAELCVDCQRQEEAAT